MKKVTLPPKSIRILNTAIRDAEKNYRDRAVKKAFARLDAKPQALLPEAARALTSAIAIVQPVVEFKDIDQFQMPVLTDEWRPTGEYEPQDVTAVIFQTQQFGTRWNFMFRPTGEEVWRKPPVLVENARLGMAALVLPRGAYELLPLAAVRA